MIGICVAVRENLAFTKQLVDCVDRHTEEPHFWVFADDASGDGTAAWLTARTGVTYLRNAEPLGYTLSMNRALETAATYGPEALVVVNNDVLVSHRCLDEMLGLVRERDLWCVSPRLLIHTCGYDEHDNWDVWERREHSGLANDVEKDYLVGACFMLSAQAYGALGGFDEAYAPFWFEDVDYTERLRQAGHPPVMTCRSFLYHYESRTLAQRSAEERWETWTKNSAYFARKWGHAPEAGWK